MRISLNKIMRIVYFCFMYFFAMVGIVFTGVFLAIRFKITNVKGSVDVNVSAKLERFNQQKNVLGVQDVDNDMANEIKKLDEQKNDRIKILCNLNELSYVAPANVKRIMEVNQTMDNSDLMERMMFAVKTHLSNIEEIEQKVEECKSNFGNKQISESEIRARVMNTSSVNMFEWINKNEWNIVKMAVLKDKELINKAAGEVGIDPRLIVSNLIVEQMRLYFTAREMYQQYFEPLKILVNANKISLGVMSIKEETATQIEQHLKDKSSPYYLGEKYENLLDKNDGLDRYGRLTEKSHYYSYLYAAAYLKQMMTQWDRASFNINRRPEIICTLFNVGFPQSKPNGSPKVGGSKITIGDTQYSFGRLGYEFFYSGELVDEFGYTQ